jgi:hypothetical protein
MTTAALKALQLTHHRRNAYTDPLSDTITPSIVTLLLLNNGGSSNGALSGAVFIILTLTVSLYCRVVRCLPLSLFSPDLLLLSRIAFQAQAFSSAGWRLLRSSFEFSFGRCSVGRKLFYPPESLMVSLQLLQKRRRNILFLIYGL